MIKKENKIILATDNDCSLLDSLNPDYRILKILLEELIREDTPTTLKGYFILDKEAYSDNFRDFLVVKDGYYELKKKNNTDEFINQLVHLYSSSWVFQLFRLRDESRYDPATLNFNEQDIEALMNRNIVSVYLVIDDFSELLVYRNSSIDETNRVYQKLSTLR